MQLLIITAAFLSALMQRSCCQEFGSPPLCLLNRLDVLPCRVVNTHTTLLPQDNEYAVYSTRIRERPLRCEIRCRGTSPQSLPTVDGDPRIYYLFSPGYGKQDYDNQQLIRYRVQCPRDHFSFFNLMSLDLEPPSCNNTNTGETKCVDYLQVSRGGGDFGFLEVCGNVTPVSLRSQLDSGTVEVILRTSEDGRFPGFSAAVVCVSTALLQGLDDGGTSLPRIDGSGVSAKLDQFNSRVRRQVEYVHRVRRSTEEQARSLACSVDDVNIPFDAGITYNNKVVSIVDMATMNVIRRLPAPINKLTILDNSGSQQEFYREAPLTNSTVMIFPGPGPLTRAGVFVFFTSVTTIPELGNISPQLVIPSGQDADVTASLLAGHVSQASNGQIECNYTDNKILLALLNRHIVNPVLETVIDVVLNCTNREQPGRIEQIAASIPLDFQFSQEVISEAEENGTVRVCVEIVTDIFLPRNVEIRVFTQDGNATEPGDYTAVNATVTFVSGPVRDGPGSKMCIDIDIVSDDDLVEFDEVFLVTAQSLDPNVNVINNTTVIIVNSDEPVFRFTQDMVTACESEGVAMVFGIELVSGTLAIPIDITIEMDNVLNTLTFPSGSVPNSNTTLNLITTLNGTNRILLAMATVTPLGSFQFNMNSATVALFTNDSEPVLYCTSFVRGASSDDGFVGVNLQNGPFRFLEQNYTSIFVNSNGDVSLSAAFTSLSPTVLPLASFNPPVLAPFWSDLNPSAGGLVLYAETQDSILLTRAANEVSTAFPGQPTFTPMSLFIATWLQVPPFGGSELNSYEGVSISTALSTLNTSSRFSSPKQIECYT